MRLALLRHLLPRSSHINRARPVFCNCDGAVKFDLIQKNTQANLPSQLFYSDSTRVPQSLSDKTDGKEHGGKEEKQTQPNLTRHDPRPKGETDIVSTDFLSSDYSPTQTHPRITPRLSNYLIPTRGSSKRLWLDPLELEVESNVGHCQNIGTKIIDDPHQANDFGLWKELLLYRQRHYGEAGTLHIWKGLSERCTNVDLPTRGDDAAFLWKSFISSGMKQEWLLDEVISHADSIWKRTGRKWDRLYETVVGGFLELQCPSQALKWHNTLKDIYLENENRILCVFRTALSTDGGLKTFRAICRATDGHRIYSSVIPTLWKRNMVRDALTMHYLFMQRGDYPQHSRDIEPLVEYVKNYGSERQYTYFIQEIIKIGIMDPKDSSTIDSKAGRLGGPSKAQKPHVKDEFGARLFATSAFTFDLILGGLKMFGVEIIGPLTFRQMALRASNSKELSYQIDALKSAGISVGESIYSKVVQKLVSQRKERVLRDVIHSDQHPDMFENLKVQESLLYRHTLSQDWRQVSMTITILSVLSDEDPHCYNVRFRNSLKVGDWRTCVGLLNKMRAKDISLSEKSINQMTWVVLPPRRAGTRPVLDKHSSHALRRLLGTFQHVIKCGGYVPPEAWKEGLKRLGMAGHWSELEKLCFWLVEAHSPIQGTPEVPDPRFLTLKRQSDLNNDTNNQLATMQAPSPLKTIFSVHLQRAIIAWGFMLRPSPDFKGKRMLNPYSSNEEPLIPWVRGILLLRQLREKGVTVQVNTVRRATRLRLATLFGRYRISKRKKNTMLRMANPWTLDEILADIDKAWGKPLFHDFVSDKQQLVNPPQQPQRPRPFSSMDPHH